MELASGNLEARGQATGTDDEVNGIIVGLNMLAEELSDRVISRDYLDNIIRSMRDMLLVVNPDGTVRTVNRSTLRILGCREDELIGKPAEEVWGEKLNLLELKPGDTERTFQAKNGRKIPVSFSCSALRDENGRVQGMVCVAQDITERKESQEALRIAHRNLEKKARDLETANEELQQYAYAVSHDIMAPLRAIHNYADFLSEDLEQNLGEEQESYLEGIKRAAVQGKELAESLLELSRVGTRKNAVELIQPGSFFHHLVEALDLPADVRVTISEKWPRLEVERPLFRQVFQNLITNAVKFNHSSPKTVEIGWVPLGDNYCELFVRDNGIGIEPRFHEQIFGVFQRLHVQEEFEGSGIGLAIVRKAAAKMNGSIRLESTPGKGSVFFVKLPIKRSKFIGND
jgi:PAS domain S-box-containing protein